jgi:Ran GTPase-activating protein (RanGAP) involved in mRNA processing and transport
MPIPPWLQENCNRLIANDFSLTNLNLNIRRLGNNDLHVLADAMGQNSWLLVLNLTSTLTNAIANDRVRIDESIQLIVRHPTLSVLHLSYNHLDAIAVTLPGDDTSNLTELYLDHNALVCPGQLLNSLKRNTSLRVLQLNCNRLSDEACRVLADALYTNRSLQVVGLRCNSICSVGASLLEGCLESSNVTIQRLDLADNVGVSGQQRSRIETLCLSNRLGRQWWRSGSQLPPELWPELMERMTGHADVLRLFLKTRPDIVSAATPKGSTKDSSLNGRKRPRSMITGEIGV